MRFIADIVRQPWDGRLLAGSSHQVRTPTLALSCFNALIGVVNILSSNPHDRRPERLNDWRTALPPKLDYLRSESATVPLTPPAVLLQLTYLTTSLYAAPSQPWVHQILNFLDKCDVHFSPGTLPPVFKCCVASVWRICKDLPLDQATEASINSTINNSRRHLTPRKSSHALYDTAHTYSLDQASILDPAQGSPDMFPPNLNAPLPTHHYPRPSGSVSLLNDLLPDMNTGQQLQIQQNLSPNPINTDFTSPPLDAYDPSISGDLDSFFEELASLHGAKKLENQPQFMENLGFAPEISMADLLATQSGHYMPMDQSIFRTSRDNEPMQFPLSDYYNAG